MTRGSNLRNPVKQALLGIFLITALPACTTTGTSGIPSASQTVVDEKAMGYIEAGFYAANKAASIAVDTGLLKPGSSTAISVADKLRSLQEYVAKARTAYNNRDSAALEATRALFNGLYKDVMKIVAPSSSAAEVAATIGE